MSNGRFAISVHILTLLAKFPEEWLSSEFLSGSININPVLVRKELSNLREKGFVLSKEGKAGGSRLALNATAIRMADVYASVRQTDLLGKAVNQPNPDCPVGRQINQHLNALYESAEKALTESLAQMTLAEFSEKFN
ncbi:transcriptional regulator [Dyadobacter luteus]|jgi:Rrf2 family protein|uniref:Transcriptional regulator n=1 Tax=Dyadobacter luteus TaxID=2259619 RepID=A0A3D8YI51_9BACT|nr:Rrf2 family transcriptional regulator [Dyadobacter luteus]REA64513.1 transcriptional regulator [Dyadobacter luteus]